MLSQCGEECQKNGEGRVACLCVHGRERASEVCVCVCVCVCERGRKKESVSNAEWKPGRRGENKGRRLSGDCVRTSNVYL